ncbi:hypothetical protein POL68_11735 [Stigmatella sp. ncwal1]|uniref:Hint domain-containing protein n=1 Tax=Stigmatella ashevillensis TaxID=2995309 RepID=A0ABT5D650_9BACT|nr:hypothetical protein [Stigmatella ashevillena]MDC0709135.1 hypothetical protein [Stigmatella ashevillena]
MTTVLLAMTLSAAGCGEVETANAEKELTDNASEVGVLSVMPLGTFQTLAYGSDAAGRCVGGTTVSYCNGELDYAYLVGLIAPDAYNWGRANGYYPVIDRNNVIQAICKCGCFEGQTLILTQEANGTSTWTRAKDITSRMSLFSLKEDSALSQPSMSMKSIKNLTRGSEGPALHVFTLDNGRTLKVTQHHGMLLSDGRVVPAHSVDVGSEFVALDGSLVRVKSLDFEFTQDEVFNFEVSASDKSGHFIAAEGVLVGDLAWQNQLSREIGSIAVRK